MQTAKLFQNGRSQAVRLPKAFRMDGKEVKISKQGNKVILEPIENSWNTWFNALNEFSNDFMQDGRDQPEGRHSDTPRNFTNSLGLREIINSLALFSS